jgi:hypothetical protein
LSAGEGLAELAEHWTRKSGWQFRQDYNGAPVAVGWEDEGSRVELAFFPPTSDALIELFDRRRARGGIISIPYGDRPGVLLDLLAEMGSPAPAKFPSFISSLIEQFHEVYDASDADPILIDPQYLDKIYGDES